MEPFNIVFPKLLSISLQQDNPQVFNFELDFSLKKINISINYVLDVGLFF